MVNVLVSFDVDNQRNDDSTQIEGTVRRLAEDGAAPHGLADLRFSGWLQLLGHLERFAGHTAARDVR